MRLREDEILKMCKRLAYKYNRVDIREDLISEGMLAIYERLNVNPDEYPASLYRHAHKSMHDYINRRSKVVHIPNTRTAESISKGVEYKHGSYSEKGKEELAKALSSRSVDFAESFSLSVKDCSQAYETQEYIDKALDKLDDIDREIIHKRYFEGLSQPELADLYGVTQQSISRRETAALNKMSRV
tara:strand:+ start:322 stop:879 length:558 start_codon:yes stop_codon:yes gene_type:complete